MSSITVTYDVATLIHEGANRTRRCEDDYIKRSDGEVSTCALGAAMYVLQKRQTKHHPKTLLLQELDATIHEGQLPCSMEELGYDADDDRTTLPLWAAIERMNDRLNMGRHAIAAWMQTMVQEPARSITVTLIKNDCRRGDGAVVA